MEMKRTEEAKRWFHQAFYDLKAARWNLEGGFFSTVCFLSQQSGEKALKALSMIQGRFIEAGATQIVPADE